MSSNADRLKKALANRSRPAAATAAPIYDDIQVDPHHASIATFSSISSGSSMGSISTPPSSFMSMDSQKHSHHQQSSQPQRSRKNTGNFTSTGGYSDAPTLCSADSTFTGVSEYSRFGKVVANSIHSYSSLDSNDSRSGRRLFERTRQGQTDGENPVFVLPSTLDRVEDDEVSEVIESYEVDFYNLDQLDAHNSKTLAKQYTAPTYYSKPMKPSTSRNIYEDHRVEAFQPTHRQHASLFDSDLNDTQFTLSDPSSMFSTQQQQQQHNQQHQSHISHSSSISNLYGHVFDQQPPSKPANRPRRNSTSSDISTRNSYMQQSSGLNLDLDSVIRNALVESSTTSSSKPRPRHYRNQPSLEEQPSQGLYPAMTNNAYSSPRPSETSSASYAGMYESADAGMQRQLEAEQAAAAAAGADMSERRNMARFGTNFKRFARKLAP